LAESKRFDPAAFEFACSRESAYYQHSRRLKIPGFSDFLGRRDLNGTSLGSQEVSVKVNRVAL